MAALSDKPMHEPLKLRKAKAQARLTALRRAAKGRLGKEVVCLTEALDAGWEKSPLILPETEVESDELEIEAWEDWPA